MTSETRAGAVLYAKDVDRVGAFYAAVLEAEVVAREHDHVVLEVPGFQLVVLRVPDAIASRITISCPPERRSDVALKPVFFVRDLERVREAAGTCGGILNPKTKEWVFQGRRVCDGLDPEGNVVQFREITQS